MAKQRKNVAEAIGRRLTEIRLANGLSQEAFAEKVGMHRTYYSAIERGEKNVTLVTLSRVTDALGIRMSSLFDDVGF